MKQKDFSPWPAIRWMAALVVYVLTVAIAISEVNSISRECAEWKRKFEVTNQGFEQMTKLAQEINDTSMAAAAETIRGLEKMQDEEDAKTVKQLESLLQKLDKVSE